MNKKFIISGVLAAVALTLGGGVAFGDVSSFEETSAALTMIWLVLSASLVFFMQAGFAMVEVGLTRAKNAANIIMKNLMDFAAGAVAYWAIGWALMYGTSAGGFIGGSQFFLNGADETTMRDWMFQVVFAATAATIVSGAMAERTKFTAYIVYSFVVSAVIYPISGHWGWNSDGWLVGQGFHDFAGSTIVHSVGGWIALAGAIVLGARRGKYIKVNGKVISKAIIGHNLPLAALGVFILWFGWFGFNAGSTLSGSSTAIAHVAATTTLSAAAGAIAAMTTSWIWFKKPDPSMSLNGALAGLVGITAGTYAVFTLESVIIGAVAGVLVVVAVEVIDKVFHIDDPVGAVSVHGVCGAWGTVAVGLFANRPEDGIVGVFHGGGLGQLGVQTLGVLAYMAWALGLGFVLFFVLKATIGLRVSPKEELEGLDISEHASEAYSGFQIFSNM